MVRYSIEDAAKKLGIDTETLGRWMASAHMAVSPDPASHEYVLDELQLDQLARAHGLQKDVIPAQDTQQETSYWGPQGEGISGVPTIHLQQSEEINVPTAGRPQGGEIMGGRAQGSSLQPPAQNGVVGQPVAPMPRDAVNEPTLSMGEGGRKHSGQPPSAPDIVPEIRPIRLDAPVVTIGRFPNNMVVLNSPQVSGYHARIEQLPGGGHRIVDLHSTNHTYVNSQQVRDQVLKPGDEISIGGYQFSYTGDALVQAGEGYSIRIDALHLKQYGGWRVTLLNDISLDIPQHSLVALVGSSGVGKTTLLDALSGIRPAAKGLVLYNGRDYYRNQASFNTQIGYVPQSDIIHKDLTVQHALYYTARMRLPKDFTRKQIKERINEVLDEVEMTHRRRMLVRNLSGGERKRVSLALELLANPSVFFLDEPTSGLDPGLDLKMMQLLRKLADKGHTIILVTHATTNINVCDFVCFLARGGRLAYYGPPGEALSYFGVQTYAEVYNTLDPSDEHKDAPRKAEERFKHSPYYQRYIADPLNREMEENQDLEELNLPVKKAKRGSPWRQFRILTRRYLELLKNDAVNLAILLFQAPIIGLILYYLASPTTFTSTSVATCPIHADALQQTGPIVSYSCQRVVDFLNSPQGAQFAAQQGMSKQQLLQAAILPNSGADAQTLLFIMAFAAVMFGVINGVRAIVREVPIYRRERMVNLGIVPYMFSKIVVLGILSLLQSAVLVYIVNLKAPYHQGIILPPFAEIYISMALTSLAGLMIGLLLSALAPNTDRAMSLVPLILIPQVIFSGVVFNLNSPILQAIGALFAARWAISGMGSTIGLHADKLGVDNFSYQGTLYVTLNPADALPGAIEHLAIVWGALVIMIIVIALATALALKNKDVSR
ncbi:MAG TPA: ATP-binding cassette domain-containing protein [Ktedonobacteraceae bacterium]|nr:ATP-binding cassette domain-containing protein [Ktedonobacteraceae bacterium]